MNNLVRGCVNKFHAICCYATPCGGVSWGYPLPRVGRFTPNPGLCDETPFRGFHTDFSIPDGDPGLKN